MSAALHTQSPHKVWTLVLASLGLFICALDTLVVSTALPVLRTDLGASLTELEWTVNTYNLAFACLLLTGAALGDRFGRRRMFVVGIAIFTIDRLLRLAPGPVIALNHAAAAGMAFGPEAGLSALETVEAEGSLRDYYLLPAARADLLRRSGHHREAAIAYREALALCTNPIEQRYLQRRLAEVASS